MFGLRARRPVALATVVFAATFAVLAALAGLHRVNDPDVFWLARAGRDLVATGVVPTHNGYAYTDAISPWVLHEVLFALGFFGGFSAMGPAFASLVGVLSAAGLVGTTMFLTLRGCRSRSRALLASVLLLLVAPTLFEPRPAYLAVSFVIGMVALAFSPGWSTRRALGCVAIELVWCNAHGSFPLGIVLLGVAAAERGTSRRERALRIATTAIAGLATVCNPYGVGLHRLVARYVVGVDETARLFHESVIEFFPLSRALHTPFIHAGQVVALLAAFALAGWAAVRRERVGRTLLVLALVGMTLYQARHLTLAVVLGVLLLCPEPGGSVDRRLGPPLARRARRMAALTVAPGLSLGLLLWALVTRTHDGWVAASLGGAPFARLVRALPSDAKVYAPFQPSGLLLWLGAAQRVQVFFDPRNDCYSPRVARMAFALESPDVPPQLVVSSLAWGHTEYALVPVSGAVYRALASWRIVSSDDGWALLAAKPLASL